MTPEESRNITRQRTAPSFFDFCYVTTHSHLKMFMEFKKILQKENKPIELLDVGCGYKPFQQILKEANIDKYIGVDFDRNRSMADIEATLDNLPLQDNSFDAIIASEILEHVPSLKKALSEIRRVAKNGSLLYISTPFIFGEHGAPYDFQRLTSYWYKEMFKQDEILLLKGTNSNLATPFFINNVVLENIAFLKILPLITPVFYFLNNFLALLGELTVSLITSIIRIIPLKHHAKATSLINIYFYSMPGGYDIIVRIRK
jgi:SAM-dependent methyltransferase